MEQNDRRKFLFLIIEKCEAADPDIRLTAARVLLYLVQGTYTSVNIYFISDVNLSIYIYNYIS